MEPERRATGSIAIGDEHEALAEAVRRFVADRCPPAAVRAAVDGDKPVVPGLMEGLAELGWLGLHLPEDHGGEGYGLSEAAIVVEELARAVAPGPILPTLWASALVHLGGGPAAVVGDLATGARTAAVATGRALEGSADAGRSIVVSGTTEAVVGAADVDLVVVPVRVDGQERWYLMATDDLGLDAREPLDLTRSAAACTAEGVVVDDGSHLTGLDRGRVDAVLLTLAAAECAGIAAWCVASAAQHACDRQQFGRPIGQFQAVKHRCADMLVAAEAARSVAWDAARALDEAATGDEVTWEEAALAAATAGAVALDAAVLVAEDCIQVLGGIGFTWEHDAHLYLRRAVALRQVLGGSGRCRRTVAAAALAGTRRRLRVDLPPEAEPLRAEVRASVDAIAALAKEDRRPALVEQGLLVPHWPAPWGRDAGAVEQLLIDEELARAKVRRPHLEVGAWAAPTIVAHGTIEQQERWVRPTLLGELRWCQLFSEPEAGSDLAGLRTTATRVDGGWELHGQKVWTTMAREADWGICLVRTNPSAPKHLGITYLIVDMRSEGIDVRPLREMTGLEMFNEVFFDGTFVPDDCVIGEVDGGWPLARTTLGNERVAMGSGSSFGGGIEALLALVQARTGRGDLTLDDVQLDRIGGAVAEAHAVAVLGARSTHRSVSGAKPGPEASVRKLMGVEHDQRTQELGLDLLGPDGAIVHGDGGQWTFGFLANRCLTIAGGTSEIQRNVIGERLLGLPRDPDPAER